MQLLALSDPCTKIGYDLLTEWRQSRRGNMVKVERSSFFGFWLSNYSLPKGGYDLFNGNTDTMIRNGVVETYDQPFCACPFAAAAKGTKYGSSAWIVVTV